MKTLLVVFLLSLPLLAQTDPALDPPPAAVVGITAERMRAHMSFLADDLLEGRGTGTRGHEIAARYVQTQFELLGLKPAGANGYRQQVPFRSITVIPEQSSVVVKRNGKSTPLKIYEDVLVGGNETSTDVSVEAPAVFVGYGVSAPHLHYDDYANADVRGKIAVIMYGAPPSFPSSERAHFSSRREKAASAAAHGAIGLVTIRTAEVEKRYPFKKAARDDRKGAMRWLSPEGAPADAQPQLRGNVQLNIATATAMFEGAAKTYAQAWQDAQASKAQSFPLPVTIAAHTVSRHVTVNSPNLAAVLPGSDPALRNEYILYTAHLDHLGIGEPVNGDSIYNGAADNSSGVAGVLELARAFTSLPQPPRRSIMFLIVTAEEKGLQGSDYFAHYPTVPIGQVAANLNMDELPTLYDFADVVALGSEHSSIGKDVERVAGEMNLQVSPDPAPEEVFFVRSDQYSLVRQGVPAVDVNSGYKAMDPKIDGRQMNEHWEAVHYHQPSDDMQQQPLDLDAAAKCSQFDFRLGYALAQKTERPAWNPGDFFGQTFAKRR